MSGGVGVGVSGAGSNLRALVAAGRRGELGGEISLVFADRDCPALSWAAQEGITTALVPGLATADPGPRAAADASLADTLGAAGVDVVVLAGYMRIVGSVTLGRFGGRILNTHPSLLPAFPGARAVRDALAHGAKVTGVTVHLVDVRLDGGPIVLQEAVVILPDDDEASLHERIKAVEHRLLPRAVALALGGALRTQDGRTSIDLATADARVPVPRRALISVSDKSGLVNLARGLERVGFELVSTGGTARAMRDGGLVVTDVSAVTGVPEMLDGRVKTLHPGIHGGILADRRLPAHRQAILAAAIAPFELVVVNLYPFDEAAERPGIQLDGLIEEIDIGGPSLVRAAAKNHASVAIVTSPSRYEEILAVIRESGSVPAGMRAALAAEAFAHTAAYDARIAEELPRHMATAGLELPDWPGLPGASDPYPATLTVPLAKVETLRYGENPHQPAARYRRRGGLEAGPFASGDLPLQGKPLSYNNVLDAAAASAIAGGLRGEGCVIVKHTNPCGAAERPRQVDAWRAALAGDPVSAYGGIAAFTSPVDGETAHELASIFLEVVVAPGFEDAARERLAGRPNLRLVVDRSLGRAGGARGSPGGRVGPDRGPTDPTGAIRTAGGAVLVSAPDSEPDDPATWATASHRDPTESERTDLVLAWHLVRGVVSNAIVLVRDRTLLGIGSGQTSRVDAARSAVGKATQFAGAEAIRSAACASDAFYPFADAVEVCLAAGATAFVQPGGSIRDAEIVAVVDAAGAAMLLTGQRHFRH